MNAADAVALILMILAFVAIVAVWWPRKDKGKSCRQTSYMCECDEEGKKRRCKEDC